MSNISVREWRILSGSRKGCLLPVPFSQPAAEDPSHCAGLSDQGEQQTWVNWKGPRSPRPVHSSLHPSKSISTLETILRTPPHFSDSSAFAPGLKKGITDHSLISLSYQIQYLKSAVCPQTLSHPAWTKTEPAPLQRLKCFHLTQEFMEVCVCAHASIPSTITRAWVCRCVQMCVKNWGSTLGCHVSLCPTVCFALLFKRRLWGGSNSTGLCMWIQSRD